MDKIFVKSQAVEKGTCDWSQVSALDGEARDFSK